jgi:excisionase family DNA binding protein
MSANSGKILKSFVTTHEASQMLGVTMRTVQLWANSGLLTCWKTEGGHRRIMRDSVERLLAARGLPDTAGVNAESVGTDQNAPPLRILIVEDEPDLLRLYRMQLARWFLNPEVATAANGYEGLVILGSLRPHLMIADLHMPQVDGFHMLRIMRTMPQLNATEIVVVTGIGAEEVIQRGGLPEGVVLLPKPIPFAELEKISTRVAEKNGCRLGASH